MLHISLSFDPNNMCLGALKSEKKCHSDGVHKYIQWQNKYQLPLYWEVIMIILYLTQFSSK